MEARDGSEDRSSWRLDDPRPSVPLAEIEPMSLRAMCLLARSTSATVETNFVTVVGAVSMVSGLEYHYANYQEHIRSLPEGMGVDLSRVRHEAVAWLNRVGQLYYLAESAIVKAAGRPPTPTVDRIVLFRHKHGAHRSADKPRAEDTPDLQVLHAMAIAEVGGALWSPRPGVSGEFKRIPPIHTHYLTFQLQQPAGQAHDLILERDHPGILQESFAVLEAVAL